MVWSDAARLCFHSSFKNGMADLLTLSEKHCGSSLLYSVRFSAWLSAVRVPGVSVELLSVSCDVIFTYMASCVCVSDAFEQLDAGALFPPNTRLMTLERRLKQ